MTVPRPRPLGDGVRAGSGAAAPDAAGAARWARLDAALDALLDLSDAEREMHLDAVARDDAAFAAELRSLLEADADASAADFLTGAVVPPPVAAGAPGARCGPYELVQLIGRGGMGSVWRARRVDGQFDGEVAIKLLGGALLDAGAARRFRREGEILAKLQHPNIGALRDAGITTDGQPYLVLELVDGSPIDAWVAARRLDADAIVRLVLQVLAAVAHAHARLVVHRDLKPSNILVDGTGRARLLDFGIAKLIASDTDGSQATALTRAGGRLLTPRYAAPEQVRGGDVSTATDVYALGVLLCELLTGRPPYRTAGDSLRALETAILDAPPIAPSELADTPERRRRLRGDLDTIVLKALRKEPEARYATVDALSDDLQRWLDGRPVSARPASAGYRLRRFVRRHAVAVGAVGVVVVAIVGGAAAALWQARQARLAQRRAEAVTAFVTGIFTNADPNAGDGTALSGRELLLQAYGRLEETFGDRPDDRLDLQLLLAQALVRLQAYDDAAPVLTELRSLAVARHGEGDPRAIRADLLAGTMHRYRGDLDGMRRTTERALASIRRFGVADTALLLTALNDSVTLAISGGGGAETRPLSAAVLTMARRSVPMGDPQLAIAAQNHVMVLQRANATPDTIRAAAAFAREATRARHGDAVGHASVITSMIVYAVALDADGRTPEAIAVLDSAVVLERTARPDMPLGRAFALGNAATYRRELGRFDAALADFDSTIVAFRTLGDTVGVNYAITLANRGETLRLLERFGDATRDLSRARAIIDREWGETHVLAVLIRLREAMIAIARGALSEADAILRRLETAGLAERRPREHALTRAWLARQRGVPTEAIAAAERGLRTLPPWSNATTARGRAPLLAHRALALAEAGEFAAARTALQEAIDAFRDAGVVGERLQEDVERSLRSLEQGGPRDVGPAREPDAAVRRP